MRDNASSPRASADWQTPTTPRIDARRSSVPAFPAGSSVEKTAALVGDLPSGRGVTPHTSDIDEFLAEEVKGPGSIECISGKGCKFSEPAMNNLINDVFGDSAIFLDCESGECLHQSQVPGYKAPEQPDHRLWVALSAALAAAIFLGACLCGYRIELGSFSENLSR